MNTILDELEKRAEIRERRKRERREARMERGELTRQKSVKEKSKSLHVVTVTFV